MESVKQERGALMEDGQVNDFSGLPVFLLSNVIVVIKRKISSPLDAAQCEMIYRAATILRERDKKIPSHGDSVQLSLLREIEIKHVKIFRTACMALGGDEWEITHKGDAANELYLRWKRGLSLLPRIVESLCLDIITQYIKGAGSRIRVTPVVIDENVKQEVRSVGGRITKIYPPS